MRIQLSGLITFAKLMINFNFFPQRLCESLSEEDQFTPTKLIRDLHEQGLALGLVLDLTNTKRYYTPQV